MTTPLPPIRVLLLESDGPLTGMVEANLQSESALRLFRLTTVSDLAFAIQQMDREKFNVVLLDVDPLIEPDFVSLARLRAAAPHLPVVALLADDQKSHAYAAVQKGANSYLLASQIADDNFSAFLLAKVERFAAQSLLKESEERFRLMVENGSDVVFILDEAGVVVYASPSTESVLKCRPNELTGLNAFDFFHRDDRRRFLGPFEKAFSTVGTLPFVQFRLRRPTEPASPAGARWIHMEGRGRVVVEPSGRKVCVLNSHDVSHRVKLEDDLRSLSLRDELTGLHNRRSFMSHLEQRLKSAARASKKKIHLLFIDLDDFKRINDTLGHKEGDRALIGAAHIFKATFRDADIIARLGGDEFGILLTEGESGVDVDNLKKRLFDGVENWNLREARRYRLSMSVGVIHHNSAKPRSVEKLLAQADELMYREKRDKKHVQESVGPAPSVHPEETVAALGHQPLLPLGDLTDKLPEFGKN